MEIREMTIDQLEERKSQIRAEVETAENLDELETEVRSINEEIETRKANEAKRVEIREQVAEEKIEVRELTKFEEKVDTKMDIKEIRSSENYLKAYVNAIKTGDDHECRAMLTELATSNGQLPVPTAVDFAISHAWNESDRIVSLCKHTNIRGRVKFSFELTNSGAVIHAEGTSAPSEEQITIGVVTVAPTTIKKWITISDELMAMDDGNFINYIYEEIMYNIVKKASETVLAKIKSAPTTATTTAASVFEIVDGSCGMDCITKAYAKLSAEARNPVIIMNKGTWGKLEAAKLAANYPGDLYRGMEIVFTDLLPAFDDAQANACYIIVGDLDAVDINGIDSDVVLKFDETSLADADLVKITGKQYLGIELIKCGRICRVVNN